MISTVARSPIPTGTMARPAALTPDAHTLADTFASAGREVNVANIARLTAGSVIGAGVGVYAGLCAGWIPGIAGVAVGAIGLGVAGVLAAAKLTENAEGSTQVGGMLIGGALGVLGGAVAGGIMGFQSGGLVSGSVMGLLGGLAGFSVTLLSLAGKSPKP